MATIKYPKDFPEALINGYGISVNMGLVRTEMSLGYAKQRRRFSNMPQRFNLTFAVPNKLLQHWQIWVNENAYVDFNMNLTSYITDSDSSCSEHLIRFISDLSITPLTPTTFSVSVMAEGSINQTVPGIIKGAWSIGGTPDDVPLDWVVANNNSPDFGAAPFTLIEATDAIEAGTPDHPSARA